MANPDSAFLVWAPYWPSRSGMFWWDHFSRDEVRRDLDLAVELHMTHLAVALTWPHFQPDQNRVSLPAMRNLQFVLEVAENRGILLKVTLLPLRLGPAVWAPTWALRYEQSNGPTAFTGNHVTRRPLRNPYRESGLQSAMRRYVRDITGAFMQHPSATDWVLGDGFMGACPPATSGEYVDWLHSLFLALPSDRNHKIWHGISSRDIFTSPPVDVQAVARVGMSIQMTLDWWPDWSHGSRLWPSFAVAYAGALSRQPVLAIRAPTQASPTGTAETSSVTEHYIERMWSVGAAGVAPALLFDLAPGLAGTEPFAVSPQWTNAGIVSASGVPKAAAGPWTIAALKNLPQKHLPHNFPFPDKELALRDPEATARESFQRFTA